MFENQINLCYGYIYFDKFFSIDIIENYQWIFQIS